MRTMHGAPFPSARLLLASLALTLAAQASAAEPLQSVTLRKIQQSGVIAIGHRESSVPFSFLNGRQQPVGYSIDICDRIVAAVQKRLGLRQLDVKRVPVTSATRIPMVANRSIDLECGVTTNNLERQAKVDFSLTIFVAESRLVSKQSQPIVRIDDLRGRSVVSTAGTTSIRHLSELNEKRGLKATIIAVKDDPEAFSMVTNDRAVAYAMDDVLLRSTVAATGRAQDYVISSEVLGVEPYGIMLPKGDAQFKRLADDTIAALYASGQIRHIYRKWFQSAIPPQQLNLDLPMPAVLQRIIAKPTDSGNPADYR